MDQLSARCRLDAVHGPEHYRCRLGRVRGVPNRDLLEHLIIWRFMLCRKRDVVWGMIILRADLNVKRESEEAIYCRSDIPTARYGKGSILRAW